MVCGEGLSRRGRGSALAPRRVRADRNGQREGYKDGGCRMVPESTVATSPSFSGMLRELGELERSRASRRGALRHEQQRRAKGEPRDSEENRFVDASAGGAWWSSARSADSPMLSAGKWRYDTVIGLPRLAVEDAVGDGEEVAEVEDEEVVLEDQTTSRSSSSSSWTPWDWELASSGCLSRPRKRSDGEAVAMRRVEREERRRQLLGSGGWGVAAPGREG